MGDQAERRQYASDQRLPHGALINARYRVAAPIGRGGMGAVFRVQDELEDRSAALKLLHRRLFQRQQAMRTRHEFHAMIRLRHPRMVEVYDYGTLDGGESYFVMELLEGTDLGAAGKLPLPTVYRALAGIADALSFMHSRGYVHRDVKPANVRLVPTGGDSIDDVDIKLMDFGAVELTGHGAGTIAGTMRYLAPESHFGTPADPRVDLYALGVVAYEITSGQYPFTGRTGSELLESKLAPLAPLDRVRPDVPPAFARLVDDLLAPEPSSRPTNCQEVIARLAEIAGDDLGVRTTVPSHLRTPALVGRGNELRSLRAVLSAAATASPRAVFVIAPAGAGKTRLWEEALLEVRMSEVGVAQVAAHGFGGSPYEVMRELMRTLLHQPGADQALELAGGAAALAALHPDSSGKLGEHSRDPVAEREAMHAALVKFIEALTADRPVAVGIDDVHLADSASLEALAAVLRSAGGARFGVAATIREGEPRPPALDRLLELEASTRLDLVPLGPDQIRDLLRATLGPVEPGEQLLRDIERASEGNVYLVLEILRRMLASGSIVRTRTTAILPERLSESDTPASLAEALLARLDHLSPAARRLATVIAVLEHDTDFDTLAAVDGGDPDEFLDALGELKDAELVDLEAGVARAHHPRVREVLVASQDPEQARALHRRVVEVLEETGADDAILGIHHRGAGNRERALECFVRAGDHRYEALAFADAGRAYRRALDLLDAAPRRQRRVLERKLCDRLGRIGFLTDHGAAIEYLQRARELQLGAGILRSIPALRKVLGARLAVFVAVLVTGLLNLIRLRKKPFASAMHSLIDAFASTSYLSTCYSYTGQFPLGLETARSLQPYVYDSTKLPQAAVHIGSATPLFWMGRFDEAIEACDAAIHILETDDKTPIKPHDKTRATAGMWATRIWCDLERGHVRPGELGERLDARASDSASVVVQAWAKQIRVYRAVLEGKLDEVMSLWGELSRLPPVAQVQLVHESTKFSVARGLHDAGLIAEAVDIADSITEAGRRSENQVLQSRALVVRALCLRAWGHYDEAESCAREALELANHESCQSGSTADHCWIILAQLDLDRHRLDSAAEHARLAFERTEAMRHPNDLTRMRARRLLGEIATARGARDQALEHLRWAYATARELDLPREIALCAHALAEHYRAIGDDSEAERHAEICEQTLLGINNRYQLRRLGYGETSTPPSDRVNSAPSGAETNHHDALVSDDTTDIRDLDAGSPKAPAPRGKGRNAGELAETIDAPGDGAPR